MKIDEIVEDPSLIHKVPDYDLELTLREVLDVHLKKKDKKKGRKKMARRIMLLVAEVYKRDKELPCVVIQAYAEMGGNVNILVSTARSLRKDPLVEPFLDFLKTALCHDESPWPKPSDAWKRGRRLVRRSVERGCMWAGYDAATTRRRVGEQWWETA